MVCIDAVPAAAAAAAAAGDADAYGSIADCYTEMDRFDRAAEFYDK
jgi:hypothetical protein